MFINVRDACGRLLTDIVAIDAEKYDRAKKQYEMSRVGRELKKCFTGFHHNKTFRFSNMPAIATGNWGCGAFMGNIELKCKSDITFIHFLIESIK